MSWGVSEFPDTSAQVNATKCKPYPDSHNIGALQSFNIFDVELQMLSPIKTVRFLLLAPPDLPSDFQDSFECAFGDTISISLNCKCSAGSLAELLERTSSLVTKCFDFVLIYPSLYWLFAQLQVPVTTMSVVQKPLSKKRLKSIFSSIFSDSILSFTESKTLIFCSFLQDHTLNLDNTLIFQVNQYFSSRMADLKNVLWNSVYKCKVADHNHLNNTLCTSELQQLVKRAIPKIRDLVLSDALVNHVLNETESNLLEKNHFLLDEPEEPVVEKKAKSPYVECTIGNQVIN